MKVDVVIPSYRRPDRVRALKAFPDAEVWVPESQVDSYQAVYKHANIRTVSDAIDGIGTVALKLNYILKVKIETRALNVLRVDDDVEGIGVWEGGEHRELSVDEIARLVHDGFRMAREAHVPLWGLNILKDKRAYSVFRPFSLLAPILGPFTGHVLPHDLWYDAKMGTKEDYDLWLQAIHGYRRTLRFQKYHYLKKEDTRGGLYASRTHDRERSFATAITRKWGDVIRYDETKKNLLDARVAIPIQGC